MKMIRVSKSPSAWKGIRVEDDRKVKRYKSNKKTQKNRKKQPSKEVAIKNRDLSIRRKNDLYLYCKETYKLPSCKQKYAQVMKDEYLNFNPEYYVRVFNIFADLIDNKNIKYISIEMFKDVNNLFIQIEEEYSQEIVINIAKNLSTYITSRKTRTKKMNSLLNRCSKYE